MEVDTENVAAVAEIKTPKELKDIRAIPPCASRVFTPIHS